MTKTILSNARASIQQHGWLRSLGIYRHVLIWAYAKHVRQADVLVRRIHDYRMYLSLREPGISEYLNLHGSREPEHAYLIDRSVRPGMCVLDIGGNIGYYALMLAKRVGPDGKVYSVEPVPANFHLLQQNVRLNGLEQTVEAENLAISNADGERTIHLSGQSNLHSFHRDVDEGLKQSLELRGETLAVKTVALSTFIQNRRRPDYLRMDVEGHEVEILESLVGVAETNQWFPTVLFETHAGQYDPAMHDLARPLNALFGLGYRAGFIASNREPAEGFHRRGRLPVATVQDGAKTRGIYANVSNSEALQIILEPGQSRCVLLTRGE